MPELTPQKKKKIAEFLEKGDVAVFSYLLELEDKFEKLVNDTEKKIQAVDVANILEQVKGKDGYIPQKGIDYEDGRTPVKGVDYKDGEDYVLTDDDKNEIVSKIKVPIVEKIIEKRTETVIKEQPIITETKVENPFILSGVQVVDEINSLSTDDDDLKIDASHIKNLPKTETRIESRQIVGGRVGIQIYSAGVKVGTKTSEIDFESGFIVTNQNGRISVVGTGSGGTWYEEVLTRTDGTTYTLAHSPTSIVLVFLNGQRLTFGTEYNRSGTTITMSEATLASDIITATYS
jgi:hypothetical protein